MMNYTISTIKGKIASLALILAFCLAFNSANVFAFTDGAYTVNTLTYYLNPDTGKTDDGGTGNVELGEGMCRSAVYEKALLEQQHGKAWITLRMLLYSNLSNICIYTQNEPKGEYTEVKYSIMKETASTDSADLRFLVHKPDCNIKVKMYVAPMGRDVCFYWRTDTSSAEAGNGDFIKSIKDSKTNTGFSDISGHWAKEDIENAVKAGLFSGTSQNTFSPDAPMTRGMFVTVLGRFSGEDVSGYHSSQFNDVSQDQYYAKYIGWANEKGLVSGTSASTFQPDTPITCEQAASIMVQYANYQGDTLKTKGQLPNMNTASSWAKDSILKASKAGIITSQNTNTYQFTSSATRADVASIIMNYINGYRK